MKVFVEIKDSENNEPFFINILKIDYIIKKDINTKIMLSSGNALLTSLSTKEVMKKINIALGRFGAEEIIKQTNRFELIDMGD